MSRTSQLAANLSPQPGVGEPGLPLLRYHASMPTPPNERLVLDRERQELPRELAAYQTDLDATAPQHKPRRERLAWQIRRVQMRMAEVEARLAGRGGDSG